ncbi:MAG: hypothetical protein IJ325_12345 [Clostridia bacterium]|nr:hypothetical protein [Clostridia bacterium]
MYPRLDKNTERKLIALGKRQYYKVLLLTSLWIVGVIAAWYAYAVTRERPLTHPTSFIFPLLIILPFFPFHAHRVLLSKTFYGRVMSAKYRMKRKLILLSYAEMRNPEYLTADVVFVGRNGEKVETNYKLASILADRIYYKPDDYILSIRGLKYPIKCPIPENREHICPLCGSFIKVGKRRCSWCRADFS